MMRLCCFLFLLREYVCVSLTHPPSLPPSSPKYTRRKFEISTTEAGNPIKQDEKNGKPRVFSKGDIFFNYGCFPRTWEDPQHVPEDVGVGGDNDPLDVCEIGLRQIPTGAVRQVKVLGVLCLIDDGEADWKVIAIDEEDRWAGELNDVQDVERLLPGTLHAIREWFRTYKIPDGKPENRFALGERFMGVKYTMRVIREMHEAWKRLIKTSGGGSLGGVGGGSSSSLARNLSVPSLEKLDMDSDHQAVFALLGPDGTPRVPGAVGPLTCLEGEDEDGEDEDDGGVHGARQEGMRVPEQNATAVLGGLNGQGGVDGGPGLGGGSRSATPAAEGALEF